MGREEGAMGEARRLLRILGEARFGPPDAATASAVDGIDDLTQLEEYCKRLPTAANWRELLGPPAGGSRRRRRRPTS